MPLFPSRHLANELLCMSRQPVLHQSAPILGKGMTSSEFFPAATRGAASRGQRAAPVSSSQPQTKGLQPRLSLARHSPCAGSQLHGGQRGGQQGSPGQSTSEQRLEKEGEGGSAGQPQGQEEGHEGASHLPLMWQHLPGTQNTQAWGLLENAGPNLNPAPVPGFQLPALQDEALDRALSQAPGVHCYRVLDSTAWPLDWSSLVHLLPLDSQLHLSLGKQPVNPAFDRNFSSPSTENLGNIWALRNDSPTHLFHRWGLKPGKEAPEPVPGLPYEAGTCPVESSWG